MKIHKLTASFGKLENETLRFHDGLNVIYAPNESGKSTWCAFIQAMLYGIDTSERAKAGFLPDKLRYAPWSGAPMEGTMELTSDRCDITVTRRTKAKNAPMQEFEAVYTGTNVPVKGMTGSNAGEMLTGVSKDVFRRSAFIAQGTVAVKGSPELEKRISAIVSSGEEGCSYSEAEERLRAWQRKRRWNRRGMLPELEGKMDETQRKLEEMSGSMQSIEELEDRLDSARKDCAELEQQVTEARRRQRKEALDRLGKGRDGLREISDRHDAAMAALSQKRDELRRSPFGLTDPDTLEGQVDTDIRELSRLKAAAEKGATPLWAILCMLAALVLALLYSRFRMLPLVIGAAVVCLAAVFLLLRYGKARRMREIARGRRKDLFDKYQARSVSEIQSALEEHKLLWEAMEQAEKEERKTRGAFESARSSLNTMEEAALQQLDFADGSSEAAKLSRALTAKRQEAEALSRQLAAVSGRLAAMGDPLVLSSSLTCMKEEYEQLCDEFDAIRLALDTLGEADEEIQSRFSPELGRVASSYMSAVTGGRYADVLINRDFSAMTRAQDDSVARNAEYLSAGTMDIMYLAVRLAVCELALPDGEPCPLILDDALVNLDEERLDQAMKLLEEIARERQVILFSCRK